MTNVIQLSTQAFVEPPRDTYLRPALAPAHSHAVQFFENEEFLFATIARFLVTGLQADERLVVIATESHREGFTKALAAQSEASIDRLVSTGRLSLLDAREVLAEFMVDGVPNPQLFQSTLARVFAKANEGAHPARPIRAYGEMVDVLWKEGNAKGAIFLEELWNEASTKHAFSLLCAYSMGNFYQAHESPSITEVCRQHSEVFLSERAGAAMAAATTIPVKSALQPEHSQALRTELEHRKQLEAALREALRERAHAEESLRAALHRESEARLQTEQSESFKEFFLGMLGHDMRSPLGAVLAAALMLRDSPATSIAAQGKLQQIVAGAMRMARMVEQIMDVTRVRLASGIPLEFRRAVPIDGLVNKIVDEVRTAHPATRILLCADRGCVADVDAGRCEQVFSNLLNNAVAHGDPSLPISVTVESTESSIVIGVHNYGAPIDPMFLPVLFDPFRPQKGRSRRSGLGLGLYISDQIIRAHGGRIDVHSETETGTRFEVVIPRST